MNDASLECNALREIVEGLGQVTRAAKLSGEYLFEIDCQPARVRVYQGLDGKYWATGGRALETFPDAGAPRYDTEESAVRAVLDLLSLISIQ